MTSSLIGIDMPPTVKVAAPFWTPTAETVPTEAMLGVTVAPVEPAAVWIWSV